MKYEHNIINIYLKNKVVLANLRNYRLKKNDNEYLHSLSL